MTQPIQPTVCCVMLTADRPELARRAVECFRAQTYPAKRLLILDSGTDDFSESDDPEGEVFWTTTIATTETGNRKTVGELRNEANAFWTEYPILIHWDDDDWSHPNRIAEQVALLQESGADCVGYREMLFWRSASLTSDIVDANTGRLIRSVALQAMSAAASEVWLYSNPDPRYCLGTSLCYWRAAWEKRPFPATSQGEDHHFTAGLKCVGQRSFVGGFHQPDAAPRMMARIHAGNTSNAYDPAKMRKQTEWRRVPEWDTYCRSVME